MKFAKTSLAGAALAFALLSVEASAQVPRGTCLIADPTGTPLNVRASPGGRVVGNLYNGDYVVMQRTTRDAGGRPWALVAGTDGSTHGWVFREFISCRN
jgi:hypothetical protein